MHASWVQVQTHSKNHTPLRKTQKRQNELEKKGWSRENRRSWNVDAEGVLISRRKSQLWCLSFWLVKLDKLIFLTWRHIRCLSWGWHASGDLCKKEKFIGHYDVQSGGWESAPQPAFKPKNVFKEGSIARRWWKPRLYPHREWEMRKRRLSK